MADEATLSLTSYEGERFQRYIDGSNGFGGWLFNEIYQPVQHAFEGNVPKRLLGLSRHVAAVEQKVRSIGRNHKADLKQEDLPVLKRAALHYRHAQALVAERLHAIGADAEHAVEIDALTERVEKDLGAPWLEGVVALPRPRLTEYVNLKTARQILSKRAPLQIERIYDEKFGILWGPAGCPAVIEFSRQESWLLGTSTCLAYVDIDDFKKVNTLVTETEVDRKVLPPFMMLLEAHTSSRGFAFRYGGDEYVIIFPNADESTARSLLESMRASIELGSFGGQKLTTSIGFVVIPDDCPLTNTEILSRANIAKNNAKAAGKNRVEMGKV